MVDDNSMRTLDEKSAKSSSPAFRLLLAKARRPIAGMGAKAPARRTVASIMADATTNRFIMVSGGKRVKKAQSPCKMMDADERFDRWICR